MTQRSLMTFMAKPSPRNLSPSDWLPTPSRDVDRAAWPGLDPRKHRVAFFTSSPQLLWWSKNKLAARVACNKSGCDQMDQLLGPTMATRRPLHEDPLPVTTTRSLS